jgi:hypothetical protein
MESKAKLMKFKLSKASGEETESEVTISTLQDLKDLSVRYDNSSLIVAFEGDLRQGYAVENPDVVKKTPEIIIYDDYVE